MDDALYNQLDQAIAEAESAKQEAFQESMRCRKAEKDSVEAICKVEVLNCADTFSIFNLICLNHEHFPFLTFISERMCVTLPVSLIFCSCALAIFTTIFTIVLCFYILLKYKVCIIQFSTFKIDISSVFM